MVLQNHNTIAARSSYALNLSATSSSSTIHSNDNNSTMVGHPRPVIDLLVAMIAVPILILCALQLEKNLHDMASSPESRWLVFALGIGMLIVSVIICGYVTHRMGVCLWAGPIDEVGNRTDSRNSSRINTQNDILRIVDSLPPSYDTVVKCDIPPPSYECLIIDMEQQKEQDASLSKESPPSTSANGAVVHM